MSHRHDATTQRTERTERTERESLNDTARIILDKAIVVHSRLGPALLESVDKRLGLLINFKVPQVMQGVKRIVNNF